MVSSLKSNLYLVNVSRESTDILRSTTSLITSGKDHLLFQFAADAEQSESIWMAMRAAVRFRAAEHLNHWERRVVWDPTDL